MQFSRNTFAWLGACFVVALGAAAQPTAAEYPADAVLRDAVVDVSANAVYVSAYDLNEVWKVALDSGNVIARAQVAKGPGALASDGTVLACVCRAAKSVVFLRLSDFSSLGSAAVGDGADDIAALPGGGFAVANSFSDSVTLVDPNRPDAPVTLTGVASVPGGIAASERYLAVSTRAPSALHLFAAGESIPSRSVALDEGASKVAALSGDRFAVATKKGVALVDAASGTVTGRIEGEIRDLASVGAQLLLLTSTSVHVYDAAGTRLAETPAGPQARVIGAGGRHAVLLAPQSKTWTLLRELPLDGSAPVMVAAAPAEPVAQDTAKAEEAPAPTDTANLPALEAPKTEPAPAPEPAPTPAPVVVESAPVDTPKSEPAPEVSPIPPAPEKQAPTPEPTPAPAPVVETAQAAPAPESAPPAAPEPAPEPDRVGDDSAAPSSPAESETPAAKKKTKFKSAQKSPWPVRRSRIRPGGEVPQPDMTTPTRSRSERPDVSPLESSAARETSIGQVVTEGIAGVPEEGGFTPPTSAEEFLDITAENLTQDTDGSLRADGNVRFTLMGAPDVQFAADHIEYDSKTGRLYASGNVEIVQGPSTAFADEITTHIYPGSTKLRTPPPLVDADDTEDDLTRKLLSIGSLDATNIDIIEPTRRLRAQRVVYDFQTQTGVMHDMEGQVGQIRFGGDELQVEGEDKGTGKNLWLTTCDCDHEYYRIRVRDLNLEGGGVIGKGAQLEIGNSKTPIYWPRWAYEGGETPTVGIDFDSGRKAELGYYLNVGQQFAVSPDFRLGYRIFPTTKEGIGFGFDGSYDYMETPASPLFRSSGEFHALYTTKDRGYYEWYHRHEVTPSTVLLANIEQWGDRDFYKEFYYDQYKDRTQPRTFVNVTHTQPGYIATATVRKSTHDFVSETERLPEVSFHLLERELLPRLYLTFDTVDGYNKRQPEGEEGFRSANVARLSTDIELGALNITPFVELDAAYYSRTRREGDSDARVSTLVGTTFQTRFQRLYGGSWGFSGFKHIVVPSVTYSYRSEPTMGVEETPRFDAYDNVYGRSRIETKLDNIVMGRDEETGESWQVARLSLYHGTDFWNEIRESSDYEVEIDIRPRSWWGFQTIGEHHSIDDEGDIDLNSPFLLQRGLIELYERVLDKPFDPETADKYNTRYGDYDRILAFFHYDNRDFDGNIYGRVGFAYTKTQDEVFNREILYGLGYRINEKWSVAFEHRYDLERGELYRQKYEVRRVMNCLEGAFLINERESGWDFGVELSVTGIPGTRIRF